VLVKSYENCKKQSILEDELQENANQILEEANTDKNEEGDVVKIKSEKAVHQMAANARSSNILQINL